MKRFIAILIACIMLTTTISVHAIEIDLSAMTLEELQELSQALNAEFDTLFNRNLGRIGSGVYVVGKNVKAGAYNLINITLTGKSSIGYVHLYANEADHQAGNVFDYFGVKNGSFATLSLSEGMVITLRDFTAEVEECTSGWLIGQ